MYNGLPIRDEPHSLYVAGQEGQFIVSYLLSGNNTPLYELILHTGMSIWGNSILMARLLSVFIISLTGAVLFLISGRFYGSGIAYLTGFFFLFSVYTGVYAEEIRCYGLLMLLSLTSLHSFMKIYFGLGEGALSYFVWILSGVLLIFCHHLAPLILLPQILIALSNKSKELKMRKGILLILLIGSPVLFIGIKRFITLYQFGSWLKPVSNIGVLSDYMLSLCNDKKELFVLMLICSTVILYKNYHTSQKFTILLIVVTFFLFLLSPFVPMPFFWRIGNTGLLPVILILYTVFFTLVYLIWGIKFTPTTFLILNFCLPVILMFTIGNKVGIFLPRYLTFSAPVFYLICSVFLYKIIHSETVLLFFVLIYSLGYEPPYKKAEDKEISQVISTILKHKEQDMPLIICPGYYSLTLSYFIFPEAFYTLSNQFPNPVLLNQFKLNHWIPISSSKELVEYPYISKQKVIFIDYDSQGLVPGNGLEEYLGRSSVGKKSLYNSDKMNIWEYSYQHNKRAN